MSLLTECWLVAAALPMAVTAGVLWPLRKYGARAAVAFAPLAPALGFAAGWPCLDWTPRWPEQSWHWLLPLAMGASLCDVIAGGTIVKHRIRHIGLLIWPLRTAMALAAAWVLVPDWEPFASGRGLWILIVTGCGVSVWAAASVRMAENPRRAPLAVALVAVALAAAAVLFQSGSAKFAELAWMLATVTIAASIASDDRDRCLAAIGPLWAILLPGLLWSGYFYTFSDVPCSSFLLPLGAALVALSGARIGNLFGSRRRWNYLAGPAAVTASAAVAMWLAYSA